MIGFGTALAFLGMFAIAFIIVYIPLYFITWIVMKIKKQPVSKEIKTKINIATLIIAVLGIVAEYFMQPK